MGADPSVFSGKKNADGKEEAGPLKTNSFVKITTGSHKGQYGKVSSIKKMLFYIKLSYLHHTFCNAARILHKTKKCKQYCCI